MSKKSAVSPEPNQEDSLEQYIEKLIVEKHKHQLPKEAHSKLKIGLLNELHDTLHRKLLERLDPDHAQYVEKLMGDETPHTEIQKYIFSHLPEPMVYLTHVLLHFRFSYLTKPHQM